jgi:hypothetical protein
MRGCAVEGPGIGRIDALGSDPNEDLVSAWLWTQHIRHAEVHTVARKNRGFHGADTHHVLLTCGSMRVRRQRENQSYCAKSMEYYLAHQARTFLVGASETLSFMCALRRSRIRL